MGAKLSTTAGNLPPLGSLLLLKEAARAKSEGGTDVVERHDVTSHPASGSDITGSYNTLGISKISAIKAMEIRETPSLLLVPLPHFQVKKWKWHHSGGNTTFQSLHSFIASRDHCPGLATLI